MPSSFGKISQVAVISHDYSELRASESEPAFDWGFDLDLPYEHLGVFARHLDSAAPITQLPVFALAGFAATAKSLQKLSASDRAAMLVLPRIPLGVIGTDHVGYGSFDLWPLRQVQVLRALRDALTNAGLIATPAKARLTLQLGELQVLPFKDPRIAFDALIDGDRSPDSICLRMDLDAGMLAGRSPWPPMPAMQTPGVRDWRLSPGSFSMSGALLIGADGCETLLPSNLATRLIRFRQTVRTTHHAKADAPRGEGPALPAGPLLPGGLGSLFAAAAFSGDLLLGYSVQYHSEWFPLGHSLGRIAYSLPLAPGEKMQVAIIDWTRRETAKRTEQTTEKDDLEHASLRERSLSEAVSMVTRESQAGSDSGSGGGLLGALAIGPVGLALGSALGIGGSSANSQAMRTIVGNTTQQLSDAFHQATSSQHELNSTVVVQGSQAETAEARTRTVANYNHSHALTILYYEVLQHQRVLTRAADIRSMLLLKHTAVDFNYFLVEQNRSTIAAALLDTSLQGCLDVVAKRNCLQLNFDRARQRLLAQGDPLDDLLVDEITVEYSTGGQVPVEDVEFSLVPALGGVPMACHLVDATLTVNAFGTGKPDLLVSTPFGTPPPVRFVPNGQFIYSVKPSGLIHWKNVSAVQVGQQLNATRRSGPSADWTVTHVKATTRSGTATWKMVDAANPGNIALDKSIRIAVTPFVPPIVDVEDLLSDDERCCLRRLLNHLNQHSAYYWRAIWLAETAPDRARRLESWKVGAVPLLDVVENTLVDFADGYAVMPIVAGGESALARPFDDDTIFKAKPPVFNESIGQLVTVPARGVFAEAKLGHCNASEIIDPTRFWDWQTSSIPDDAPAIAPTSTDSRATGVGTLPASGAPILGEAPRLAGESARNARVAGLMNSIRSAAEIPEATRTELITTLLTNQVASTGPEPGAGAGVPGVPSTATRLPNGLASLAPDRAAALSPKSRILAFTFVFDTGDAMFGQWTIELNSGGESRRETRVLGGVPVGAGGGVGNRVEMYLEESFGGAADVTVRINGTIAGLPWTLRAGTRSYDGLAWAEPRDITADIKRSDFLKAHTIRIEQASNPITYTIDRTVEPGQAETQVSNLTAGLEVGVENPVTLGAGGVLAEGQGAISISARGTFGNRIKGQTLAPTATGFTESVIFAGFKVAVAVPTITTI